MHVLNESERRQCLQDILINLSRTQDTLKAVENRENYFSQLESVYYNSDSENFRHYYSDIFACLTLIDGDTQLGNLDILAQNIQTIKDEYIPQNKDSNGDIIDIHREIVKLYDHTNLDIARINYTKRMTGEALSELSKTKNMVDNLKEANKELHSESKKLKDEINDSQKKMQNEYITILGIFASIVLAFTGGMTFSSSVLENMDKSSIYRIILVICLLGIVLFNIIWMLIKFLCDINDKKAYSKWYAIAIDFLLLTGIALSIVAYKLQWL